MPKEIVFDRDRKNNESYYARVSWDKDQGHVSIATVNGDGGLMIPETTKNSKTQLVPFTGDTPGWFVNLDRAGINRLIRTLRKARDDAFGRDE